MKQLATGSRKCCEDLTAGEFHCGLCHNTYRGLGLFDKHQNRNYNRRDAIRCRSPLRQGLAQNHRGTWCTPEGLKQSERLVGLAASGRAAKAAA